MKKTAAAAPHLHCRPVLPHGFCCAEQRYPSEVGAVTFFFRTCLETLSYAAGAGIATFVSTGVVTYLAQEQATAACANVQVHARCV